MNKEYPHIVIIVDCASVQSIYQYHQQAFQYHYLFYPFFILFKLLIFKTTLSHQCPYIDNDYKPNENPIPSELIDDLFK